MLSGRHKRLAELRKAQIEKAPKKPEAKKPEPKKAEEAKPAAKKNLLQSLKKRLTNLINL